MGRPAAQISTRRRSSSASAESMSMFGRPSPAAGMALACIVALALCVGMSSATSYADLDSDLVETETGWQFDDDTVEAFDNATAPAPAPAAAKAVSGRLPLDNGDFEKCNVTGNASVLATDATVIPNWMPGQAGVQIIQAAGYKMSTFATPSLFAVHLNNPAAAANGTQGLLATTLATAPATGKSFTIQYDCARMPDGPLNLLSALKVSSISGTNTNSWTIHTVKYNATDTVQSMTWQRQSFVFEGTGAATKIQFESMSEKYGPAIDNVVLLSGAHPISAAPAAHLLCLWQTLCPIAIIVTFHFSPLTQLMSLLSLDAQGDHILEDVINTLLFSSFVDRRLIAH